MRWFWIADINLNEPVNLFQLLGQPQAHREGLSVSLHVFVWLSVSLVTVYWSVCYSCLCVSIQTCTYANGCCSLINENTCNLISCTFTQFTVFTATSLSQPACCSREVTWITIKERTGTDRIRPAKGRDNCEKLQRVSHILQCLDNASKPSAIIY